MIITSNDVLDDNISATGVNIVVLLYIPVAILLDIFDRMPLLENTSPAASSSLSVPYTHVPYSLQFLRRLDLALVPFHRNTELSPVCSFATVAFCSVVITRDYYDVYYSAVFFSQF